LIQTHPAFTSRVAPWTRSRHRWRRRAAAVCLIPLARTGAQLRAILAQADRLLGDDDPMVQKGVGWLLKEATRRRAPEVVAYLRQRAGRTTSLGLRYATENLPHAQRRQILGMRGPRAEGGPHHG
jgi:3-methyladenine DNA glycosylase AlkD